MLRTTLLLSSSALASASLFQSDMISVGPQIIYHFDSKQWSFGVEASFWYFDYVDIDDFGTPPYLPLSWNLGYEWSSSRQIIYSEAQVALPVFLGFGIGPALVIPHQNNAFWTLQNEAWATMVGGLSLRSLHNDPMGSSSLGVLGRVPLDPQTLGLLD